MELADIIREYEQNMLQRLQGEGIERPGEWWYENMKDRPTIRSDWFLEGEAKIGIHFHTSWGEGGGNGGKVG
jgi:hypothetical protein